MPVNRADWCKVRANQALSMLWQPCVPPTITMLRISELRRNTQYVKLQSLISNDGSSWLPLPKSTWCICMQMKVSSSPDAGIVMSCGWSKNFQHFFLHVCRAETDWTRIWWNFCFHKFLQKPTCELVFYKASVSWLTNKILYVNCLALEVLLGGVGQN